jgi:dTDP-glucose 4,6-dehydratase
MGAEGRVTEMTNGTHRELPGDGLTLLVAGGAGFIGSNFIRHIRGSQPGWRIVNVDALTYAGNLANLEDVEAADAAAGGGRYRFVRADICDAAAIRTVFEDEKPDAVVNFAAETHVDRSIDDPAAFLKTNILGTQVMLDAARKGGVARYLQISTDEVYGSLGPEGRFSESSPLKPNSPYAASKTSADLLVRAYFKTYGLPTLVTRCSNNYGPFQFPEKLIPFFVTLLHEGKQVPVYGDGMNVRDWIHVDDHSRAVEAVLLRGRPGEIYNVGGGNERTNIEITKLLIGMMGRDESSMKYVQDRPGHDRRYAIDDSKIRAELGVVPQVPFDEGLRATVRWYLDNEPWWRAVKSGEYLSFFDRWYTGKGR